MADLKISQLTSATTPLAGTEVLPVVQSGTTKKVAVADLTAGRVTTLGNQSKVGNSSVFPFITAINGLLVGNDANASTFVALCNQDTGASSKTGFGMYPAGGSWEIFSTPDVSTFLCPIIATYGGNEKFRWDATGNYIPKVAGKGINFTANTPAAGMTSQLLNWYEEGTWTPALGGSTTYTTQIGKYTRVGRLVTIEFVLVINAIGTGSTNVVSGLPFTCATNSQGSVGYYSSAASVLTYIAGYVGSGTAQVFITGNTLASASIGSPNVFGNGTRVDFSATYTL